MLASFSVHKLKEDSSLTNSKEQSPSYEANGHSAAQESLCVLWNVKIHYHVHKNPPLVSILSQTHPIHALQPYFSKIHSNIIFSYTPRSS